MTAKPLFVQLIAALLLVFSSCSSAPTTEKNTMQKFDWQASTCAPKAFPVRLISASLRLADGEDLGIQPMSLIADGWGESGATSVIGDGDKAVPASIDIQWFSYVERKCYGGHFNLDPQVIAKIFEEKLIAPASDAKADYNYVVVGMAPKGGLSLWLTGEGVTREVAHFQAPEVQVANMQEVIGAYPSVEAYAKDVIAKTFSNDEVRMDGVPEADLLKWSGIYRKGYKWHFAITATAPLKGLLAHYFNGEAYYWPKAPDSTAAFTHPLPDEVTVRWESGNSHESATLKLDDSEVFAAFDKLGGPAQEAGIRLEINRVTRSGKAFVENGSSIIELKKTRTVE